MAEKIANDGQPTEARDKGSESQEPSREIEGRRDTIDVMSFLFGGGFFGSVVAALTVLLLGFYGAPTLLAYLLISALVIVVLAMTGYWAYKRRLWRRIFGVQLKDLFQLLDDISQDVAEEQFDRLPARFRDAVVTFANIRFRMMALRICFMLLGGIAILLTAGILIRQTNVLVVQTEAIQEQTKIISKIDKYEPFWEIYQSDDRALRNQAFEKLIQQGVRHFRGIKLSEIQKTDVRDSSLQNFRCIKCLLSEWRLYNVDLSNAIFASSSLRYFTFVNSSLVNADFSSVRFRNYQHTLRNNPQNPIVDAIYMRDDTFAGSDLSGVNFMLADLKGVSFGRAKSLAGVDFTGATMEYTNFSDLDLATVASFRYAKMHGVSFRNSKLIERDLTNVELVSIDFTGANLTGADLSADRGDGKALEHVNFTNANLTNANLSGRVFGERVIFDGTILTGAIIDELENLDLTGAIIDGKICGKSSIGTCK